MNIVDEALIASPQRFMEPSPGIPDARENGIDYVQNGSISIEQGHPIKPDEQGRRRFVVHLLNSPVLDEVGGLLLEMWPDQLPPR